jgi:hypothetical protein
MTFASGPAAESRQPGCKASGESQRRIPGEKLAFLLGFSWLSMGQKPSNFCFSEQQTEVAGFF